MILSFRY